MYERAMPNTDDGSPQLAGSYRFWTREHVRFDDLDMLGHANNKAFTTYAESGRAAFLREIGLSWGPQVERQSVIVHLELDYHGELHYPAELRVGVNVRHIGRTSFTLGFGIFEGERCVASGKTVFVRIDAKSRKPVALDQIERGCLLPHLAASPELPSA
jgi:acyl-CoA thioester hydrolase